jgi:hypothetical protein
MITASFKTLSLQGVADATSGAISFTYVFIKKKKLQKESYGTTMYVIDTQGLSCVMFPGVVIALPMGLVCMYTHA